MSYKVKSTFTDRFTGQTHQPGDVLELTDERAAELTAAGVLAARPVKDEPAPPPAPPK